MNAILALEDGTWYQGVAPARRAKRRGEVVFNTSMTGYQEVLTDPSYAGQIVTMTAPQIGNYGVAAGDAESQAPRVAGFVMREASPLASNWRADGTLRDYLVRHHIVAIADIDTRALTRVLRQRRRDARRHRDRAGRSRRRWSRRRARSRRWKARTWCSGVTCERRSNGASSPGASATRTTRSSGLPPKRRATRRLRVAAYDFGMKYNILRRLDAYGCDVHVFPASAPAAELPAIEPDGIFLSNGPGDPAALPYAINNVRELVEVRRADVRHLPRSSDSRARRRRRDVQAEVRASRRESSGEGAAVREGGDHLAESRLRRGSRFAAGRRHRHAREPVRRHGRRLPAH